MPALSRLLLPFCVVIGLLCAADAHAERLYVGPEDPLWAHVGAAVLLILHNGGGAIGILAGSVASGARKGRKLHRVSGKVFLAAMFVSYLVAGAVAPFLATGQRPNFVAAILALYLLLSGVSAARRRTFTASTKERLGLLVALVVTTMGLTFAYMGMNDPSGTVDGAPPPAFVIFVIAGSAAAVGELRVLIKGALNALERQMRHLWRMCASFFIASASFFLGQPQVFPEWFNATPLPFLLGLAPLAVMVVWLVKLKRQARKHQGDTEASLTT